MLPRTSEEGALLSIRGIVPALGYVKNENIIWIDAFLFIADFAANIASSVVSRSNVTGSVLIFNACSKVRFHSATLQFRWMKGPPQCLVRFFVPIYVLSRSWMPAP